MLTRDVDVRTYRVWMESGGFYNIGAFSPLDARKVVAAMLGVRWFEACIVRIERLS